jgi:ABC-2 type transport system ATP-binding protein
VDPTLRCQELTKRFGDRVAVDDVSFEIAAGETYGLLGPNGAGKTTTISMLCGLLGRDGGTVELAGFDLDRQPRELKSRIGYVPQDLAVYPDLTATENLRFFGRLQGLDGAALEDRIEVVLDTVGLADRSDDRSEEYSGGMKRRLNIAVGLLHEPLLLVLDEPTVGVDPQSRNAILESVERLGGGGMAVLYTTHYMEEAERLCDRVGVIDEGRLIAEGTRRELIQRIDGHDRVRLKIDRHGGDAGAVLGAVAGVSGVTVLDGEVEVVCDNGHEVLADLLAAGRDASMVVTSVELIEPDLETVFLELTGKGLRD